jgi:hypothetical protein
MGPVRSQVFSRRSIYTVSFSACALAIVAARSSYAPSSLRSALRPIRLFTTSIPSINLSLKARPITTFPRMPSNLTPPQIAPQWNHTPKEVMDNIKAGIDRTSKAYDAIASLSADQCTFQSVFVALADAQATLEIEAEPLIFYQNVSPSKDLRDAANDAEVLLRNFAVEAEMRLDLFQAATNAKKNIDASNKQLTPEEGRLIEKTLLDGVRAGLALPEEDRTQLTEVRILHFPPTIHLIFQ